jgi:DNA-binding MarR family transcriptional regulator
VTAPLLPRHFADRAVCVATRIGQTMNRLIEAALEPVGLKLRHYTVLHSLAAEGVMSQREIGELLSMDPATTATTVDELVRDGLLARDREPDNRRKYAVELTAAGRRTLQRAEQALDALESAALADLAPVDRKQLRRVLGVLAYGEAYPALVRGRKTREPR